MNSFCAFAKRILFLETQRNKYEKRHKIANGWTSSKPLSWQKPEESGKMGEMSCNIADVLRQLNLQLKFEDIFGEKTQLWPEWNPMKWKVADKWPSNKSRTFQLIVRACFPNAFHDVGVLRVLLELCWKRNICWNVTIGNVIVLLCSMVVMEQRIPTSIIHCYYCQLLFGCLHSFYY